MSELGINVSDNDSAKIYKIYYWVSHNIAVDYSAADLAATGSDDDYTQYILPKQYSAYVFVTRKAVCLGYATAFRYLAKLYNIKSYIMSGVEEKSTLYHAWNKVKINKRWVHLDCNYGEFPKSIKIYHDLVTETFEGM